MHSLLQDLAQPNQHHYILAILSQEGLEDVVTMVSIKGPYNQFLDKYYCEQIHINLILLFP